MEKKKKSKQKHDLMAGQLIKRIGHKYPEFLNSTWELYEYFGRERSTVSKIWLLPFHIR